MVKTIEKIEIWTEGLNKNWVAEPNNRQRISRGHLVLSNLSSLIENIRFRNDGDPEGILILQGGGKRLHIIVQEDAVLLSDPVNPNYQNVAVKEEELTEFIEHYFRIEEEEEESDWMKHRMLYYGILTAAILCFGGALYFLLGHISLDKGFYPRVSVVEISNESEFHQLKETYEGIYATGIWDGAMVIELSPDQTFRYMDMKRSSPGRYILEIVMEGNWRPVYELGASAVLADERLIMESPGKEKLRFENRNYSLIGKSRQDVPFMAFPE